MRTLALLMLVVCWQDPDPAKLTGDLSSSDPDVREKASKALVELGKKAVAPVTKLLESKDAEVKARAAEILAAIRTKRRTTALTLTVAPDKKVYKPGERVTLAASLKNVEEFDVDIVKFIYDGGVHAQSWITVTFDGKRMNVAGDPLPQVMIHHAVREERFATVKPGASFECRKIEFSKAWDLGGKDPSLKDSYAKGTTVDLKPGSYKVKATWKFKIDTDLIRKMPDETERHPQLKWSFEGKSKEMLLEAWQGSLEAEAEFEVKE